ncbi:MAG TPA: right-handed parallel beta-helix repeat-containing protein, partial [Vicinamibacterales bacterium]|nr:right-handed parallel beta-helix repeat-containing protein [Vicinamibacterales bacterium]
GIEATFSRNRFIANRIEDCWHGVWGGYSFDSLFARNRFARNTEAIAIEHGQNIRIAGNTFKDDDTAIRLWANATQDPNWGYPKARDTRSRNYVIDGNTFDGHKTGLKVMRTDGLTETGNRWANVASVAEIGVDSRDVKLAARVAPEPPPDVSAPPPIAGAIDAMLPEGARRGRETIIVDEWGPYDFKSPKLWPVGKLTDRPLKLRVLGPEGTWRVRWVTGAAIDRQSGSVPGELTLTMKDRGTDVALQLEYVGAEVVTPRGRVHPQGSPIAVSFTLFEPDADWAVDAWTFPADADPISAPDAFQARLRQPPARRLRLPRLDLMSSRAILPDLPNDRIALRAETRVDLPRGEYDLIAISDDGIRVWVDDVLEIDRWSVHESVVDRVPIAAGRHRIRIEYFEATGWAELQVRFLRR